jgi:hypothetical protein
MITSVYVLAHPEIVAPSEQCVLRYVWQGWSGGFRSIDVHSRNSPGLKDIS